MRKINNPDTSNVSPEYWEKVLTSHGLGIDQPLTDNSEGPTGEPLDTIKDRFEYLRKRFDGDDRFMKAHEIKKARGLYSRRTAPDWTASDKSIQEVLLRAFPKLSTSEAQRKKAGRWLRAIYLFYRMRLPRKTAMKELGMNTDTWKALIRSIRRAAKGLRADGSGKRANAPIRPSL